jgi:hypothetical protein
MVNNGYQYVLWIADIIWRGGMNIYLSGKRRELEVATQGSTHIFEAAV